MKPCTSFRTSCPLLFSPDLHVVVMQMYHAYNRCTVLTHLSQTSSLYSSSIVVLWGIHTRGNLYQIYLKKCMNHHRIMKGVYIHVRDAATLNVCCVQRLHWNLYTKTTQRNETSVLCKLVWLMYRFLLCMFQWNFLSIWYKKCGLCRQVIFLVQVVCWSKQFWLHFVSEVRFYPCPMSACSTGFDQAVQNYTCLVILVARKKPCPVVHSCCLFDRYSHTW